MKKTELVDALAGASGQSKAAVTAVLDALPDVVVAGMKEHGSVVLPGLGKMEAKAREARTMRNPATGAPIDKPATTVAGFKPAKPLKDAVAAFPIS
jgi:DNA-binding protein HU-beta